MEQVGQYDIHIGEAPNLGELHPFVNCARSPIVFYTTLQYIYFLVWFKVPGDYLFFYQTIVCSISLLVSISSSSIWALLQQKWLDLIMTKKFFFNQTSLGGTAGFEIN